MAKFAVVFCFWVVLTGCMESQDQRFERLNRQGIDHYARREYPEAITSWQAAHDLKPAEESVLVSIGTAHLKLAALPQAIESFEEAVRLFPDRVDIRCELVRLMLLSRDIAGAETQLKEVKKLTPDSPQLEILHGDIFLFKNQPDLAEKAYKIAASYPELSDIALSKLAFSYLVQGKVEEADKTFQIVVDMATTRVPVLLQMHYYWKFKDDFEKAHALIQQALTIEPDNLSLRWELAEFYFGQGRYESAQACLEKILTETPKNRSAAIFLVEILMARNELQAAGAMLDKLAKEEETTSGIALLQGKYHLLSNAPIIAVGCFKKAIQLDPTLTIAHYLLGLSYFAEGRRHLARASLTNALKIDPLFTDAELMLADLYYEQDEFEMALIHSRRVVEREKTNYRARLILGHIYLGQNQIDNAGSAYTAARQLYPDSIPALYYSAVAAEKARQNQTASELYKKILDLDPGLADVGLRYSRLLVHMGQTNIAVAYFEQAAASDPQNGFHHYILGEAYLASGQSTKAKQAFQTAMALVPTLVPAYNQLAAFAEKSFDHQTQIQLLNACIVNNPTYITAYLKLAQLYRQEWRWEAATRLLEKGLAQNPDSGWLSNSLAWIYLEQDQQANKALELAQAASEKLPEEVSVSDTLGWAYHKKGFHQQAIWVLKAALLKEPSNAMVAFHLGLAQQAGGEFGEAKANLKHALAMNLKNPYKDEAESLLAKMNLPHETSSETQWKPPEPQMTITDVTPQDINKLFNTKAPESSDIGLEDLKPEDLEKIKQRP